jgi:Flp pilus assembly protein TadD
MAADPTFPLAYRRLADLHYERRDFAGALELYRKALAERPDDFAAAIQAGNSARRTGRLALAAAYFQRAAHDRPASWVPVYNLACLDAVKGDRQGALTLLASMKGFQRPPLLENDRDLATVRSLPGYPAVLQKLKDDLRRERRAARQAQRAEGEQPGDADPD